MTGRNAAHEKRIRAGRGEMSIMFEDKWWFCNSNYIFFATVRLPMQPDAGRRHRGRSKPTPRHKGPASCEPDRPTSEWKETPCRYRRSTEGANGQGGVNGGKSTIRSPPPSRPALKDRECQSRTAKVGRQAAQDQPSSEQDGHFGAGQRNQAEGRGMSEAVTVEDKTNRYNANATGRQEQFWPASPDAHTTMAPASGRRLDYGGGPADGVLATFK